jgi:predicted dehydrogenase
VSRVRVGFVGLGRIADLHILGYRDDPRAGVYSVCDALPETAERRAQEWGVERWCTDYQEMLADPALDALEILTPHHLHAEMTVAALEAGKHVSVQKPMALNLAEADAMIQAAERTGKTLRVYENFRFYPPYVRAKQLLDAGEIGEPLSLRVKVIGGAGREGWPVPWTAWAWRLDEAQSGGGPSVFDHGYHIFSIAMLFLGHVERVFAWIDKTPVAPDVFWDAPSYVMWKYRDGQRYGCWETVGAPELVVPSKYYSNDEWVEITGSRGVIWVTRCSGEMLPLPPLVVYRQGELRTFEDMETDWSSGFVASTREFVDALAEGRQPEMNPREGREVLRFSLAAHLSSRERREVELDELSSYHS